MERNRSQPPKGEFNFKTSPLKFSPRNKNSDGNKRLNKHSIDESEPSRIEVENKLRELSSSPDKYSSERKPLTGNLFKEGHSADLNPFNVKKKPRYTQGDEEKGSYITPK